MYFEGPSHLSVSFLVENQHQSQSNQNKILSIRRHELRKIFVTHLDFLSVLLFSNILISGHGDRFLGECILVFRTPEMVFQGPWPIFSK